MSRPLRSSRPSPGREVREALVAHAIEILEGEGPGALSLRELASRVGVSQPALYRHFVSKEALLDEVIARGTRGFAVRTREAMEGQREAYGALGAYARAYVRHAVENRGWFRLAFGRSERERGMEPEIALEMAASRDLCLRALACVVPPTSPAFGHTFRMLWSVSHGLASMVTERVFQLVSDDDARLAAADLVIDETIATLRARWGEARPMASAPEVSEADLVRGLAGARAR